MNNTARHPIPSHLILQQTSQSIRQSQTPADPQQMGARRFRKMRKMNSHAGMTCSYGRAYKHAIYPSTQPIRDKSSKSIRPNPVNQPTNQKSTVTINPPVQQKSPRAKSKKKKKKSVPGSPDNEAHHPPHPPTNQPKKSMNQPIKIASPSQQTPTDTTHIY